MDQDGKACGYGSLVCIDDENIQSEGTFFDDAPHGISRQNIRFYSFF